MRLFSTDLDGTIFDGSASAEQFAEYWDSLASLDPSPVLVYNTGRSLDDSRALVEKTPLPHPQFYICGVGTQVYGDQDPDLTERWHRHLSNHWNYDTVREVVSRLSPARIQPRAAQNAHKCSWWWEDAPAAHIAELVAAIQSHGLQVQSVYSSNRDLDFLPVRANKGNAVAWLADQLGVPLDEILVAGDSGNDASMYQVSGVHGIIVANAEPALVSAVKSERVYHAAHNCAAGVIEGISRLLTERKPRASAS